MQQIKCDTCEHTKFFVNSIAKTSMISCCECGASFILGAPNTEPIEKEPEQVEPTKPEFVEEPEVVDESEIIEEAPEEKPEETPVGPKPAAVKMTPEQKQEMLKKMEQGGV